MSSTWKIGPAEVDSSAAVELLLRYYREIVGRYHRRATTDDEVRTAMAEAPNDDLVPPRGIFLIGWQDARPAACIGLRPVRPGTAEVTRMFVTPEARGRGLGGAMLAAAQEHARHLAVTVLRLDTRHDLVEARGLYAKHGFREVPRFNDEPYADHWFEKHIGDE